MPYRDERSPRTPPFPRGNMDASDIKRALVVRIESLVVDLLPNGHREGHEWRCGSLSGEPGNSLAVHLTGAKAGIWCDFSTGQRGDILDLIQAILGLTMIEALDWSCRWLGLSAKPRPV
jgi:hypothetical protein